MPHLPKNTLAYLAGSPYTQPLDVGHLPLTGLAAATKAYKTSIPMVLPDKEAVEFYALNHLVSILKSKFTVNEVLPEWGTKVLSAYIDLLASQGPRLVHYTTCIIARETRHNENQSMSFISAVSKKFGYQMGVLYKKLEQGGEASSIQAVLDWTNEDITIAQYTGAVKYGFDHGTWGHSFGGKAWATITEALEQAVTGVVSLEAFVDRAYNLAHNNGPMFNKDIIFENYTHQFVNVLDVQRSGQIPELIAYGFSKDKLLGYALAPRPAIAELVAEAIKLYPEEFGQFVDWVKVEASGSSEKYPAHILQQEQEHPGSTVVVKATKATAEVDYSINIESTPVTVTTGWSPKIPFKSGDSITIKTDDEGKGYVATVVPDASTYEIMPGQTAKVVQRKKTSTAQSKMMEHLKKQKAGTFGHMYASGTGQGKTAAKALVSLNSLPTGVAGLEDLINDLDLESGPLQDKLSDTYADYALKAAKSAAEAAKQIKAAKWLINKPKEEEML